MPTNEAGLSGGEDQGDGGRTSASDMDKTRPEDSQPPAVGADRHAPGQVSTEDLDRTDGGHLGRGGDPVEGVVDPAATGRGPADGQR
jgi:hypothetical protein